ncbi:MAG TPA: hypothetical protein VLA60_02800, partial [Nitrospirales bacterium]|nr:hypothetical protein [Nitrospirales bacterium]
MYFLFIQNREGADCSSIEKKKCESNLMMNQKWRRLGARLQTRDAILLTAICVLMGAIFALDLFTQTGVAIGMLYVSAIMLTPWVPHAKSPFIV